MAIKILESSTWREHNTQNKIDVVTVKEEDLKRLQEYADKLEDELKEVKEAQKSAVCMFCGHRLPIDYDDMSKMQLCGKVLDHLLECKNHPLAKRIAVLVAEMEKLEKIIDEAYQEDCDGCKRVIEEYWEATHD